MANDAYTDDRLQSLKEHRDKINSMDLHFMEAEQELQFFLIDVLCTKHGIPLLPLRRFNEDRRTPLT